MNENSYWNDSDPTVFWAYREAFLIKEKAKSKEQFHSINQSAWLSGLYIKSAIASAFDSQNQYMSLINIEEIERRSKMSNEEIYIEEQEESEFNARENIRRAKDKFRQQPEHEDK